MARNQSNSMNPAVYKMLCPLREHRDAAFLPSHQKDHPEPFPQGCSGFMKDGSCGERDLIDACLALVQVAGAMEVGVVVVTPGAVVTLWPAQTEEMFLACFLCCKSFLKFNEAHWFCCIAITPFTVISIYYTIF